MPLQFTLITILQLSSKKLCQWHLQIAAATFRRVVAAPGPGLKSMLRWERKSSGRRNRWRRVLKGHQNWFLDRVQVTRQIKCYTTKFRAPISATICPTIKKFRRQIIQIVYANSNGLQNYKVKSTSGAEPPRGETFQTRFGNLDQLVG